GFSETFGEPALGGPVRCAGADADNDLAKAELPESFQAGGAAGRSAFQTNAVALGKRIEDSRPVEQFQIVEPLMTRDLAALGNGDCSCQKKSAAVAIVADALGNAGYASNRSRFKG